MIADVRGYTNFTENQGDERAADLARDFAALARAAVSDNGGDVIELRGDEALAVFTSARQALRAGLELQRRSRLDSPLPLGIGIGIDAGEAMPVDGGYRGGALNLASRLCGMAAPGQILVSETVVGLSRKVDGLRFVKRRAARLKGLEKPVHVIEAVPDPPLPPLPRPRTAKRSLVRRHKWSLVAAASIAIALAVALSLSLSPRGPSGVRETVLTLPRSFTGVATIDPRTDSITRRIPLTGEFGNGSIAYGARALWTAGSTGITKVDLTTGKTVLIPITGGANAIAAGDREGVWEANANDPPFDLLEIDPYRNSIARRVPLPGRPTAGPYVGAGFVWLVMQSNTIWKIDPADGKILSRIPYDFPYIQTNNGAAAGEGAFWFADPAALQPGAGFHFGAVIRVDANANTVTRIPATRVNGLTVAGGAVWARSGSDLSNPGTGKVTEVNPDTSRVIQTVDLGRADWVKAGRDAVWVATSSHGVTRLNPATGDVVGRLVLPTTTLDYGESDSIFWVIAQGLK
jgi:hypothetical protein